MILTGQTVATERATSYSCKASFTGGLMLFAVASASFAQVPAPASREDAAQAKPRMEEIVVTARKREESYQDVPVALQVFSGEDVERYAASNLTQIAEMATQVQLIPTAAGTGSSFVVRGISSSNADVAVQSSVVINQDGFPISRGRTIQMAFFDVASVEILKGPQALFFGKNSPAGVVSIRSAQPTPEWEFKAKGYYEFNAEESIAELIASGPLSDTFGIRVAYRYNTSRGWLDNVAQPHAPVFPAEPFTYPGALDRHLGGREGHLGRITFQYDPNENLSVNLKLSASTEDLDATGSLRELISCAVGVPRSLGQVDPSGDCSLNGRASAGAYPRELQQRHLGMERLPDGSSVNEFESRMGILNLEYEGNSFNITSVTGAHRQKWYQWDNFDGTVFNLLGGNQAEEWTQYSEELRFLSQFDSPINFMVGGFFEQTDRDTVNNCKIAPLGFDPATGLANSCSLVTQTDSTSTSVFGQLIWTPIESLEIAGGARWSREEVSGDVGYAYVHSLLSATFLPVGTVLNPEIDDTDVSPEATIRYKISPDVSVYVAYKTGYKAGGHSAAAIIPPTATAQSISYLPEEAEGYEVGLKTLLADGRLRANVTAYRYLFDNAQDAVFIGATTSFEIRNSDSKSTGVEADVNFQATRNLRINAQLGYNEAKFRRYPDAACWGGQTIAQGCISVINPATGLPRFVQDISGRTRALAPEWTGALGLDYELPVSDRFRIGFSGSAYYTGKEDTHAALNPYGVQDSVTRFNASVRFGDVDEQWEMALIGVNITNERYWGNSLDQPGGNRPGTQGDVIADLVQPRQVAVQATVRF